MNNKLTTLLLLSIVPLSNIAAANSTATIYGKPYYPSDYTPEMTVYARSLSTGETYSVEVPNSAPQYKIRLRADLHIIFWDEKKS